MLASSEMEADPAVGEGDGAATARFERTRLIISASLDADEILEAEFAGKRFRGMSVAGAASVIVNYAELYAEPILDPHLRIYDRSGAARQLALPLLVQQIDIRTSSEFTERVQSLRKRMTDNEAVRFAARRLLMTPDQAFDDRAAAVCAIGYRIVEGGDRDDSDTVFLRSAARETIAMGARSERYARWTTSMTMVLTYIAILMREPLETELQLTETLSYRHFLPQLSLLHTNFSRCNLLLALIRAARNDVTGARACLADIDQVFRIGVRSSWIDHNIKGRSQFSEIFAVLKVVRLAAELQSQLDSAAAGNGLADFAAAAPMASISPIVRSLQVNGHWQAVLDHNSGSKVAAINRKKWLADNV